MFHLKHIPLEGAHNFRDLGGCPTIGGGATKWGMLYRSDALSGLTQRDWAELEARNVRTVIDLRSGSERAASPITPPDGVVCLSFSLMRELDGNAASMSRESILQSMKLDYVRTLFGNLPCGAEILNAILERLEQGAVVFLCSAGKDRTGIVAALVLYLCGVPREDIIADYIVSSTYNTNGINAKLGSLPEDILRWIPDPEILRDCLASKPETIIALLDALEQKDIRALLAENGFPEEKQRLLERIFTC